MLPEPLHPAIVHFPIVLVVLLPFFALGALVAIRRGVPRLHAWAFPLIVAAALAGSSWVAVETGEAQEDRVESVVSEGAIHAHEENAERFLVLSGIVLVLAGLGLVGGRAGTGIRLVTTVAAVGLVVAGARVGSTGGELVYRHGAARAYTVVGSQPGDAAAESATWVDGGPLFAAESGQNGDAVEDHRDEMGVDTAPER